MTDPRDRFDALLDAMLNKPPLEKADDDDGGDDDLRDEKDD